MAEFFFTLKTHFRKKKISELFTFLHFSIHFSIGGNFISEEVSEYKTEREKKRREIKKY